MTFVPRPQTQIPLPEAVLRVHEDACDRGEDGYIDPSSGFFVMTSLCLVKRGDCCGNGCRHCPWPEAEQRAAQRPDRPAYPYRRPAGWMPR